MSPLRELVEEELRLQVDPRVTAVAAAIAAQHGGASRAMLFYGSCLREKRLEGRMLDFYLIVSDYRAAYGSRLLAAANRLIPPNVFYFEQAGLVSKYAVLSEDDFAHECSPAAWTVSTAARFAQPSRLVWSAAQPSSDKIIDIVAEAAPTLLGWTRPLEPSGDILNLWQRAFELTFRAELRAERQQRVRSLVEADAERYRAFGTAALGLLPDWPLPAAEAERWWKRKQAHGRRYSIARLGKAAFTFSGGADYIVWKINRHSGAGIELKPWQRRHPLLAGISLLPRLLKSGAVR